MQRVAKTPGQAGKDCPQCVGPPMCTYFFGAIRWSEMEVKKLNTETRTIMKCQYLLVATERLYLPTEQGGRGTVVLA